MTHTLSPWDTDSRLELPEPAESPTTVIPARRLPRPEATGVIYMPPREFVLLPDLVPVADLTRTDQITLPAEQPRARRSVPLSELLTDRPEWTGPKHRRPSWLAVAWARVWGGAL